AAVVAGDARHNAKGARRQDHAVVLANQPANETVDAAGRPPGGRRSWSRSSVEADETAGVVRSDRSIADDHRHRRRRIRDRAAVLPDQTAHDGDAIARACVDDSVGDPEVVDRPLVQRSEHTVSAADTIGVDLDVAQVEIADDSVLPDDREQRKTQAGNGIVLVDAAIAVEDASEARAGPEPGKLGRREARTERVGLR